MNLFGILPGGDPVHAIVMNAEAADVDSVMVAGRFLKRGGELVGADLPGARDLASSSLDHLLSATQIQPSWVQSA
jgi:hypothetical protein